MRPEEAILSAMSMVILAGVGVLWLAMSNRRKLREMEHRERLALIERGLIPAPEVDPLGFEAATGVGSPADSRFAERSRSVGVIVIGLGVALMMLISFAGGELGVGIGVGGAVAALGAAFLVNAMSAAGRPQADPFRVPMVRPSRPTSPPEPPHNIAP